ncbi:class I SAM-dependent RNA methyltransferase [Cryptosporangium aurantiacum]|uniref:23S rRNA m(5)U-1939 methyltransferase n=1 Tax=Cryptosporangium aurantiacum TaxID=134849 RepID=A0A1M7J3X5_9ACTN|nr:TRAM domain-containing protein [Cryptosporangium aurantiacum]SHM47622.1 23S rRNA m(5)U-1939 methyltransferase [Cryptosporangium aurantiacum]
MTSWAAGTEFELEIGAFAHGGHCVGRHDGRVVFVRHALPGERVLARVTEDRGGSFCRADAVEVLRAAPERVEPPCPYAHPGGCGGCDLQHAAPSAQRSLKAGVVREQLERLGALTPERVSEIFTGVEELPGGPLGWRTRVQFAVDPTGRAGLHPHRSRAVLPVESCPIADPRIDALGVTHLGWPGVAAVEAVVSAGGDDALVLDQPGPRRDRGRGRERGRGRDRGGRGRGQASGPAPTPVHVPEELPESAAILVAASPVRRTERAPAAPIRGHRRVRELAAGRRWYVRADGFWQVHPAAPDALVSAVVEALGPRPGESVLDLYAGAGLFAGVLGSQVGPDGRVVAVEADRGACDDARRNVRDLEWVEVVAARVDRALGEGLEQPVDLVVLDPPRSGAGAAVVRAVAARGPRAVAYVACDPAAFARDVATFAEEGYRLTRVRAFDAFPMTHHVECVGTLLPR